MATAFAKNGFFGAVIQSANFARGSSSLVAVIGASSSAFIGDVPPVRLFCTLPLDFTNRICFWFCWFWLETPGVCTALKPTRPKNAANPQ